MAERTCPLSHHAHLKPEQLALLSDNNAWTYLACDLAVQGVCQHLKTLNVAPQSRVAFIARKNPHTIFLLFALFRLKAIACPLSFREPPEKIPHLLDTVDATHYVEPENIPFASGTHTPELLSENDLATCLMTSGSSGRPKAACHTIGNHFYNALGAVEFFSLNPSSRWLLSLPLFHVGGLAILFRQFIAGGSVVLSDLPLIDALKAHTITHLSLVPTLLARLLREEKDISPSLQCLLLGGAPLPSLLLKTSLERGLPLYTTYGLTETSSILTAAKTPSGDHTGKTLPYRECTLSSSQEILVRGETLFTGYWDKDAKTYVRRLVDGWFPTGDLGEFTAEGNLRILGRADRLFISGGENIQPEEIERALCSIPGIASATVLPIPDPEWGQRPVAFIQDDTAAHTIESVREALHPLLPSFKHPVRLLPYPPGETLKMSYAYLKECLNAVS